jgi:hypothetical protein
MGQTKHFFEVKQDGQRKARLVAGGHMVDAMSVNSQSTVVKGISVRLLDHIAHRDDLPVLCGDTGNAFITAECMEKIYTYAGPEFGKREGRSVLSTVYNRRVAHSEPILPIFYVLLGSPPRDTIVRCGCENVKRRTDTIRLHLYSCG